MYVTLTYFVEVGEHPCHPIACQVVRTGYELFQRHIQPGISFIAMREFIDLWAPAITSKIEESQWSDHCNLQQHDGNTNGWSFIPIKPWQAHFEFTGRLRECWWAILDNLMDCHIMQSDKKLMNFTTRHTESKYVGMCAALEIALHTELVGIW